MLIRLLEFWAKYSRREDISGHGDESIYLVRYHLMNNRFFKLYLHYFLRSDHDVPHSHPWPFHTLMLRGSYKEELYDWKTRTLTATIRTPYKNSFLKRKAEDIHRVIVNQTLTLDQMDIAPMTLFFATKKTQEWGFVKDYETAPKWTHWKEYLGVE